MQVIMNQLSTVEDPVVQIKVEVSPETLLGESNNNDGNNTTNSITNAASKPSVYDDVLGTNDQELARRQYPSDDGDEQEGGEKLSSSISRHKRIALEANSVKLASTYHDGEDDDDDDNRTDVNNLNFAGRAVKPLSDHDRNDTLTNGYLKSEYDEYSSSSITDNSNHENEIHENQRKLHAQHQALNEEPEQMRKLFIGGLDYKTSEETLKQHFGRFGDVTDCVVMREPQSKRSRGFGFVIYANAAMVDNAQEARPHEVDGREVQSKRAISREDSGKPEAQATVKKVYLGGLSDDIEEAELREYFTQFGNIVNINIVAHKDTGKRRGFAFVEYDDYDPVDKIVLKKFHTIRDKRIEAKKAIPKVEMDARKRVDPRAAMANAMIALSGPSLDSPIGGRPRTGRNGGGSGVNGNGTCLWDSGPYVTGSYPANYSGQASLDGYPPHYHPANAHYGANSWMIHGGQGGGSYGFRNAHNGALYGRNYANQASSWTSAVDYEAGFAGAQGGIGPTRVGYQHRGWGPYGSGYGTHRGRGYNP